MTGKTWQSGYDGRPNVLSPQQLTVTAFLLVYLSLSLSLSVGGYVVLSVCTRVHKYRKIDFVAHPADGASAWAEQQQVAPTTAPAAPAAPAAPSAVSPAQEAGDSAKGAAASMELQDGSRKDHPKLLDKLYTCKWKNGTLQTARVVERRLDKNAIPSQKSSIT